VIYKFPGRFPGWHRTKDQGAEAEARVPEPDEFAASVLAQLPRLRRYAIALVRDATLADDLVQDCAERALRNRQSLDDPARMPGWLRSILRNLYRDALRRERRRGTAVEWDDQENLVALSVAPVDRSAARDLVRAMETLSVDHREILLLVALEERSYRDVAAELNIPIGTVMSRLARARAQLRAKLEDGDAPGGGDARGGGDAQGAPAANGPAGRKAAE
jgi:RNA polymerase sigma-70 factor (ECF subfamily)